MTDPIVRAKSLLETIDSLTVDGNIEEAIAGIHEVLDELAREDEISTELTNLQGKLLTGVVNALRGDPPKRTYWSHHDAPERARALVAELAEQKRMATDEHIQQTFSDEFLNTQRWREKCQALEAELADSKSAAKVIAEQCADTLSKAREDITRLEAELERVRNQAAADSGRAVSVVATLQAELAYRCSDGRLAETERLQAENAALREMLGANWEPDCPTCGPMRTGMAHGPECAKR